MDRSSMRQHMHVKLDESHSCGDQSICKLDAAESEFANTRVARRNIKLTSGRHCNLRVTRRRRKKSGPDGCRCSSWPTYHEKMPFLHARATQTMLTISPAGPSTQVQDCGETAYCNPRWGFGDAALAWRGRKPREAVAPLSSLPSVCSSCASQR